MKSNLKIKFIIAIVGLVLFGIFLKLSPNNPKPVNSSKSYTADDVSSNTPDAVVNTAVPDSAKINTTTATTKTPTVNQKSSTAYPPTPLSDQDPFAAKNSAQRDHEQFREITEKTSLKINEQMRQEEITSLRESIRNDKILLKKIEDSGTDIEDYKYIEQNLKKRIKRLQVISQNKKSP